MKTLAAIALLIVSGCSLMPSKWDQNQARAITDIRQEAGDFDCKGDIPAQLNSIEKHIEWFHLYSDYRKAKDIDSMVAKLDATVKEFQDRLAKGPASQTYCQLKKTVITEQVDIIGHTVGGSLQ
jgi:HAMP domain-containing protein